MGFLGPLHETNKGNCYVLLLVDSASRWCECFPLPSTEAPRVAEILYREIFTRYGAPCYLVSDRGKQFMSSLVLSLCELFTVKRISTTPYHPQTNAACETMNSFIAQTIRAYCDKDQSDWDALLPAIMMAYRLTPAVSSTGFSPYRMLFGREMSTPLDRTLIPKETIPRHVKQHIEPVIEKLAVTREVAKNNSKIHQREYKSQYDKQATETIGVNDLVLLHSPQVPKGMSNKLYIKYKGPYYVAHDHNNNTYTLRDIDTQKLLPTRVSGNRLKRYTQTGSRQYQTVQSQDTVPDNQEDPPDDSPLASPTGEQPQIEDDSVSGECQRNDQPLGRVERIIKAGVHKGRTCYKVQLENRNQRP